MSFEWVSIIESGDLLTKLLTVGDVLLLVWVLYLLAKNVHAMKKPYIIFTMAAQTAYIAWRVLFTVPLGNPLGTVFAVLLVGAEVLGAFQAITHRLLYLRDPLRIPSFLPQTQDLPAVDLLVCTYNEPVKVIEKTVAAAASLSYPKDKLRIYVCDDGKRKEIGQIAEKYGAQWITRPDNKHAKAGNINHCLRTAAKGEFFVILDADVVVRSKFLERTMGYFYDSKVAFVQAPQVFYTPDPFQHNLLFRDKIPNEQDYFMREIQPRRASYNATLFVGSNGVFRRASIDEIGLIPTESITEDIATSLLLEAHGYRGVTVDEVLAVGLSAESFADYVTQHERWGRGNIQVLKKYKPLTRKGLSFMQRLLYFDGIIYWFFGLQKLIYIVCPIFFLFTGIPIFRSDLFTMLLIFLPTYMLAMSTFRLFSYKNRNFRWAHIYEVAMAPYMAISALLELLFSFKLKFKVTPKGQSRNKVTFSFKVALPHILLSLASLMALYVGIGKLQVDPIYMVPVYLLNIGWVLYNLWSLILNILVCFERPRYRSSERLSIDSDVRVSFGNGLVFRARTTDMSECGCGLAVDIDEAYLDTLSNVKVYLARGLTPINGTVVRCNKQGKTIGVQFNNLSANEYAQVVKFIFDKQEAGYGSFKKHGRQQTTSVQVERVPVYQNQTVPIPSMQPVTVAK